MTVYYLSGKWAIIMQTNAIEILKLTKHFKSIHAVEGIDLSVHTGEIFGLLGPNGSGKSTTIRMICGVITPTSGDGNVLGYKLTSSSEAIKAQIGYMSQSFGLYNDLTVAENLYFYGRIYGMSKKAYTESKTKLLQMVGLLGKEKIRAGTLSGGWKQRLALCCALIHSPKLLILDEPTAGVDPVSRKTFWELIQALSKTGITILVTTHYMDEASICDRIGFIYKGRLMAVDTPSNFLKQTGLSSIEDVFIAFVTENDALSQTQTSMEAHIEE